MADDPDNIVLVMLPRIDEKLDRLRGINRRLDRLEIRVERSERRLDLVEH
jgi:hypothetical protein